MPTRKSSLFTAVLIAVASLAAGMVIASRMDLAPYSAASTLEIPASNTAPITGPLDATTFRTIATSAGPSVVSIITTATQRGRSIEDLFGFGDQFQFPQRPRRNQPTEREVQGAGSGFIIDDDGYILTNHHVVDGATRVEVKLAGMRDGERLLPAKVIASDQLTDTALIQITDMPENGYKTAQFGDSSQIGPGDWVMAIGNPFALSNTVTVGVVSAVGRTAPQLRPVPGRDLEMIQTDAAINRGNSGGPLLNLRGEVIGINTAIFSSTGGNVGVGFAVPINLVKEVLPQLRKGKVVRSRIAVNLNTGVLTREDIDDLGLPSTGGAMISEVAPGGPADKAGLRPEDVIIEYNGKAITDNAQLTGLVTRTPPGTTVPIKIVRNKKTMTLNVTVEELDLAAEQGQLVERQRTPREAQQAGFGMTLEPVSREMLRELNLPTGVTAGAVVADITPSGPAAQGGLQPGDVILRVNSAPVRSVDQVSEALDAVPSGRLARVVVWRVDSQRRGNETLVQVRKR